MHKKINKFFKYFEISKANLSLKQIFSKKTWEPMKFLPKALKPTEKMVLGLLALAIIVSVSSIWRNHWLKTTHEVPTSGGTLIEGVVGESKDLDKNIARLTGAGLTREAADGSIKGDLAESWQILDGNKTYQFKIRKGYSAQDLLNQIQNQNAWSGIDMSAPDDQTLVFKFKTPFSPFLYVSTEPIFNYGPYQISKEQQDQVILSANKNYWQGAPYISTIQINFYPNHDSLVKAAKRGEITSYIRNDSTDYQTDDSQIFSYALPRELDLFFNLSKSDLQDVNVRRNLRDGKSIGKSLSLTLVTSSDSTDDINFANQIKTNWKNLGVNVEVKTYDNITLQKDIIPNRTYDLLLYSLDYGPDPDPYPFWHSSQISKTGINLSDFSNKSADKLLEDARQSFDSAVRDQKYQAFGAIITDQVPFINVQKYSVNYVVSNQVKSVEKVFGFSEADRFMTVNEWYIKSKRVKN